MTTVDPLIDVKIERTEFKSHEDEHVYQWCMFSILLRHSIWARLIDNNVVDDPALFKDAPVGLQLVGRTQEEEGVLGMTEVVDRALKEYRKQEQESRS